MANITSPLTGLERKLLTFFIIHITEQFAIREVARLTRLDYKRTHTTIQNLVKKGILIKTRQANIDLCCLNLKGDLSSVYYVEMLRAKEFLDKHVELKNFFETLNEKIKTLYYALIIFGSFARGKEKKTSDVDLLIIAPTRLIGEEIERIVGSESILLNNNVQPIVLDEAEFIENLSGKKVNVVVEVFKNHIIITGVEAFYTGVKQTR